MSPKQVKFVSFGQKKGARRAVVTRFLCNFVAYSQSASL